ncbi:DUF3572 domain-containing protein [Antarcticirhabdus aurantiaca]|uniref:DUF3572 domain-containing protein n=1 Tax=Antarcticirhabdus aurantiaca TaxID=2606717 RepID=A0ACD4NWC2_9HYPH|nr:DUF3572 domain-containing protein [Antarcticirhabdus aurantiaca]WAJ31070.1 DUF3572 domain-containing protein [Jeongeuplla avenae]
MIRERKPAGPMGRDEADAVGVEALSFLAGDPKLLARFLDLSGIEPMEMRARISDPAFFAGLLDFLLAHEGTLAAFSQASGRAGESVAAAREALSADFAAGPR